MKTIRKPFIQPQPSLDDIIGSKENYRLLKTYYHFMFTVFDRSELFTIFKKTFKDNEMHKINATVAIFEEFGIKCVGFDDRKELVLVAPTKSDIQMMVEGEYPLKCDNCNCPDDKCEGYTKEQIAYFRKLGRKQIKISEWPKQIFS